MLLMQGNVWLLLHSDGKEWGTWSVICGQVHESGICDPIIVSAARLNSESVHFWQTLTAQFLCAFPLRALTGFRVPEIAYENIHVDIIEFNITFWCETAGCQSSEQNWKQRLEFMREKKALYSCRTGYNCDSLCQQTRGQNLWRPNVFTSVKVTLFVCLSEIRKRDRLWVLRLPLDWSNFLLLGAESMEMLLSHRKLLACEDIVLPYQHLQIRDCITLSPLNIHRVGLLSPQSLSLPRKKGNTLKASSRSKG